jgi:MoxR-like ATPase
MSINTVSIRPVDLYDVLPLVCGEGLSAMVWGVPGVGKTMIVEDIARNRLAGGFFDCRLPGMDPSALRGLQVPDLKEKVTIELLPDLLPRDGHGIIFLDEITAARQDVQVQAYGLILERRIGRYRVPDGFWIVAAGNGITDGAVHHEMGTALSDRLVHFRVVPHLDSFVAWYARDPDAPTEIPAFLKLRPDLLSDVDRQLERGDLIGPSPRSWARFAAILRRTRDRRLLRIVLGGLVGEAAAAEFFLALDEIEGATAAVDIVAEDDPARRAAMLPRTVAGLYNLVFGLAALATDAAKGVRAIEVVNDMDALAGSGLPVGDVKVFAVETILGRVHAAGGMALLHAVTSGSAYARFREARARFAAGG